MQTFNFVELIGNIQIFGKCWVKVNAGNYIRNWSSD